MVSSSATLNSTPKYSGLLYSGSEQQTKTNTPCSQSHVSKNSFMTDDHEDNEGESWAAEDIETAVPQTGTQPGMTDTKLAQTKSQGGAIYIEFAPNDKDNPFNWPAGESVMSTVLGIAVLLTLFLYPGRKVIIAAVAFLFAASSAITQTGYNSLQSGITQDLGCSPTIFLFGNTLYLSVGLAFSPLILAPVSEMFGRMPIFLVSSLLFGLFFIPLALTRVTSGLLLARLFQGCVGSVGNSLVGGTVSDLYSTKHRGFAMSLYALTIYFGQSIGPLTASYTLANPNLGWRWTFGWQGILAGVIFVLLARLMHETRGSVILSRRAREMTRNDPNGKIYKCRADDNQMGFSDAVKISLSRLSRPAWWLISEPIVTLCSLWIGFLWGTIFLLLESVPIVFEAYGWTNPQKSLVLLCLAVGSFIGWIFNLHQEKLYARAAAKAAPNKPPPEARLYWACVGGVLTPVGFFIFAWTGRAGITPVAPIIGLIVFCAATFWIYLAVFTYIAECYEIYASSGLAAQSWLRNVFAGVFPLFAPAIYHNLRPEIASTILGIIAAILGIFPFILFFHGATIRSNSKAAKALEQEVIETMQTEREKR